MTNKSDFTWAVGIENTFIPQSRPGLRPLDEYELTQHYQLWREDIDKAASLGVTQIRWGIPWYRVCPEPGVYDWRWIDEVLDYLINVKGIQPIVDLMHYGTSVWMENAFLNASYPRLVAEYAAAFTRRYKGMVRYYTPLNEPTVNAEFCGRNGQWPPYLVGEDGYVKILMPVVKGMVLTAKAIRAIDPDAVFVQVEALGWVWGEDDRAADRVARHMEHTYLAFDLLTGRFDTSSILWPYLQSHGVTEAELAWFQENAVSMDILGVNLYPWSGGEFYIDDEGKEARRGELNGGHLYQLLRATWERYRLPMMITETSARRDVDGRALWMDETIDSVRRARAEGIDVVGYTWFPAITMIDWAYRTGDEPLAHYLLHLGLWDSAFDPAGVLQRHETPLVDRYRGYINQSM